MINNQKNYINNVALYRNTGKNNHLSLISFQGQTKKHLKDTEVLDIFKNEITPIYRESGHCEEISNYLAEQLRKEGFKVVQQEKGAGKGNIFAERNVKNNNAIVLQAHMDMVYVSKDGQKKSIELIEDQKCLKAKDTTLGADDGIGVALALGVARIKDPDYRKIPLQIIYTVDEEPGLLGAKDIPDGVVKGNYLINLDNGNSGKIITGCAGIDDFEVKSDIPMKKLSEITNIPHKKMTLEIKNAKGGHSALDINKGGLNPIACLLDELNKYKDDIKISSFSGGEKINTIPTKARAEILIPADKAENIEKQLRSSLLERKKEHNISDPNLCIGIVKDECASDTLVLDSDFQKKLFKSLSQGIKTGVVTIKEDTIKPTTSQNIGILDIDKGKLSISVRLRSNDKKEKETESKITQKQLSDLLNIEVNPSKVIPVCKPAQGLLKELAFSTYNEVYFNREVKESNTHGTVELAAFVDKVKEQVGIGPDVRGEHSLDEKLIKGSLRPTCNFLEKLIEKLNEKINKN